MGSTVQYTIFLILAPLAAISVLVVITLCLRYRATPGARSLLWLMLMTAGWLIFDTLTLLARSEGLTLILARITYVFVALSAVTWLVGALQYAGRTWWLAPSRLVLLLIIPTITILTIYTNDWYGLFWQTMTFVPAQHVLALDVSFGPWFWVHFVYSYICVGLGTFLITGESLAASRVYRQQATLVLIGILIPLIVNVIYVFHLIPGLTKDFSPIGFSLAGMTIAFNIFRYRLLDISPIARRMLVDSLEDGMLVLDNYSRIIDLNPAIERLIGLASDHVLGKPADEALQRWPDLVEYIHQNDEEQLQMALEKDDFTRYCEVRLSPVFDQRGRTLGRLIILQDTTDRVKAEAERERLIKELDAFGHTVAHDLKSPLNNIVGFAAMLEEDGQTDPMVQQALTHILQNGLKMNNIIDELMILAGVREGTFTLRPLDMSEIVQQAMLRLSFMIEESDAEIVVPANWPVALGYAPWGEEIWANYLSNALKYSGQPPRIVLGATLQPDKRVRFWVQDNGEGISPEDQSKLFVPFTQLNQAQTKGHGLGLSIVQRIVDKLGGEVGVESEPGQGSTFSFTLPAANKRQEVSLPPERDKAVPQTARPSPG
jgi:PAS domain S-box-containing protein